MSRTTALLILLAAAILEAGGDAIVRMGLHSSRPASRTWLFVVGGLVLFSYGWVVNAPPWDFGKLLGLYVVFFFIVAQAVSFLAFHQVPSRMVLFGGVLIAMGGVVVSLAKD